MKQTQKLEALISRILKEELEERDTMFISSKDPKKGEMRKKATMAGVSVVEDDPTDPSSDKLKEKESEEEKVADTEVLESTPTATELSGKLSEIIDSINRISEGGKDEKHKKHAAKVMKAMEAAKTALEAMTAHEMMLEEKEKEVEKKEGEKHVGKFKKALTKLVKDPAAVEKIGAKMSPEKIMMLKKQMNKELDEEKLAKAMLKHSLKEAALKKKSSLKEADHSKFKDDLSKLNKGIKNFGESLKKAGFDVDKGRK